MATSKPDSAVLTDEVDASSTVDIRVRELIDRMTVDEKLAQLTSIWVYELFEDGAFSESKARRLLRNGIGQITRIGGASSLRPNEVAEVANRIQSILIENTRLGIPAIVHEECCSGYMGVGATSFPQAIGIASTWAPELVAEMADIIRIQMRAIGAHQALSPVLDVTRDPRWGRVEETFGEDTYLVASLGVVFVKALQTPLIRDGVVATAKHFLAYGMPEGGMNWAPAHIGPRELREVHLPPFAAAVQEAGLKSVMNAYHELDGVPCAASRELLTELLRDELGFDGIVVSDYFAIKMLIEYHRLSIDHMTAAVQALEAGIDVELPTREYYGDPLKQALEAGLVAVDVIDEAVHRVLTLKFDAGVFDDPFVEPERISLAFGVPEFAATSRRIAQHSMVLLKNDGILPLSRNLSSIAVIGPNANERRNLLGDYSYPCHIESLLELKEKDNVFDTPIPDEVELIETLSSMRSILDAIRNSVSPDTEIRYEEGCTVKTESKDGFDAAIAAARASEVAVVVVGGKSGLADDCTCGEARDRAYLGLPGVQEELVHAICETGTPVVAVVVDGRPLSIPSVVETVPGLIMAWLPGEEGADAVSDVIFGDFNPGGKLPISMPRTVGQVPIFYNHRPSGGRSHWKETYSDESNKPLFAFGYGLSYTAFAYDDLRIASQRVEPNGVVHLQLSISNVGPREGDEVVQLYTRTKAARMTRPVMELKGFKRLHLAAGETRRVQFDLPVELLGFYDHQMRRTVEEGEVDVMIGGASDDIRLNGRFEITESHYFTDSKQTYFSTVHVL